MSGWISVDDRLPEFKQECLVAYKWYADTHLMIGTFYDDKFVGKNYHSNQINNVTHWQPLPETPQ